MCIIMTSRSFEILPNVKTSLPKRNGTRMNKTRLMRSNSGALSSNRLISKRAPFDPISIAAYVFAFITFNFLIILPHYFPAIKLVPVHFDKLETKLLANGKAVAGQE